MPRTRLIALAFQIFVPHHERLTRSIMEYGRRQGWQFAFNPDASQAPLDALKGWTGDGVLGMIDTPRQVRLARGLPCPVVNLSGDRRDPGLPTVTADNERIGAEAAEHLLERGFSRFGYYGLKGVAYSEERGLGFRRRVEEAGYTCDDCVTESSLYAEQPWHWDQADWRWLKRLRHPVGILTAHDYRALMVLEMCRRLQLEVPRDVAVIGVEVNPMACQGAVPSLTSVDQDPERIGWEAAVLLDGLMAGKPAPTGKRRVPPRGVVARTSTDTIAVDNALLRQAIAAIEEGVDHRCGVDQIARRVGVSRRWLEQLFQEHLRCTPHEYLTKVKTNRVLGKLLTTEPQLRLGEVARRCGFADTRH